MEGRHDVPDQRRRPRQPDQSCQRRAAWARAMSSPRSRIGDWQVTPGLRYEDITLTRKDFATDDPGRDDGPTRSRRNRVTEWIPGLSTLWQTTRRTSACWRACTRASTRPDRAVRIGLGRKRELRVRRPLSAGTVCSLRLSASTPTTTIMVGTVTESTGGGGEIGDQFDGGEAHVTGLELVSAYRYRRAGALRGVGARWSSPGPGPPRRSSTTASRAATTPGATSSRVTSCPTSPSTRAASMPGSCIGCGRSIST